MIDMSKFSDSELLDYQYNYLIHYCIRDLEEMLEYLDTKEKGLFACDLHMLLVKYCPNY